MYPAPASRGAVRPVQTLGWVEVEPEYRFQMDTTPILSDGLMFALVRSSEECCLAAFRVEPIAGE